MNYDSFLVKILFNYLNNIIFIVMKNIKIALSNICIYKYCDMQIKINMLLLKHIYLYHMTVMISKENRKNMEYFGISNRFFLTEKCLH